jgi:hypothetical protein
LAGQVREAHPRVGFRQLDQRFGMEGLKALNPLHIGISDK